jgi:hypothetical protein
MFLSAVEFRLLTSQPDTSLTEASGLVTELCFRINCPYNHVHHNELHLLSHDTFSIIVIIISRQTKLIRQSLPKKIIITHEKFHAPLVPEDS